MRKWGAADVKNGALFLWRFHKNDGDGWVYIAFREKIWYK